MADAVELYNEGDKLKDEAKYEEAIEKFLASAAADEAYALPHLALSIVYGRIGKHAEAVAHAEKACEIEPDDSFNFTTLSTVYQRAFAGTQNHQYIQMAEEAMARAQMMEGRR